MGEQVVSSVEVERKFDVEAGRLLPDLGEVAGVSSVLREEPVQLEAVYFDTADLRLRSARITLRHRTGGSDAGWHLKLPSGRDREELRVVEGSGAAVPEILTALVRGWSRGAELAPVVRLSTVRRVQLLVDGRGSPLVEIADDDVTACRLSDGQELRWREWEAELVGGQRALLDDVQERLVAAGAALSLSASKVGRVLTRPDEAAGARPWWAQSPGRRPGESAATVVHAHLAEQVAELQSRHPHALRDRPDAVHKMRVATRRLRSALATYRPLLDRESTDPLRDELRWLAGVLGEVRDAEVMHARLRKMLAAEPPELVLGAVQQQIDLELERRHREAHARLVETLADSRYLRLLDDLVRLVDEPPFQKAARKSAAPVLAAAMRRTWKRLERVMDAAAASPPGPEQEELLHEVRKDAKRARYAAESLVPVFGDDAKRFAAAMTQLQESLGDVQDGVATRQVLRELGARCHVSGRNGFTFGRLHALEQARAEAAAGQWAVAQAAVSRRRLRRWFER
jgi:CHAD domain-containing protein